MVVALRALSLVVVSLGLVSTAPTWERDPDVPCGADHPECEYEPPGPMPVVHARLGEQVTFHCYAYSPCAEVILDLEEPVDLLRVTLVSGLAGGYGSNVLPPDDWPEPESYPGPSYGNGWGFGEGGPQKFDHYAPFNSTHWSFGFAPMSGQLGGDIVFLVEKAPETARAAWMPPPDEDGPL